MDFNLRDKCVLLTAASQGLGRACAEALATEGAKVAICSRSAQNIFKVASEISFVTNSEVVGFTCDLTKHRDIERLVKNIKERFKQIDILIFNHGNLPYGSFLDVRIKQWQEGLKMCLWPAIYLCNAFIPGMKKQQGGRIIFISSIFAKEPDPAFVISSTLRAGLLGLAKCLAHELAPYRITVNTVLPGYFDTPLIRKLAEEQTKQLGKDVRQVLKEWTDMLPTKILPQPSALGHLVAWLASEQSYNVTGTAIVSDGGLLKGVF